MRAKNSGQGKQKYVNTGKNTGTVSAKSLESERKRLRMDQRTRTRGKSSEFKKSEKWPNGAVVSLTTVM